MPAKVQWATVEGGMAQGFPLSLNQSADWLSLRRGECYRQDQVNPERDGLMEYVAAPTASQGIFYKKFVDATIATDDLAQDQINYLEFNGIYYWIDPNTGAHLKYGTQPAVDMFTHTMSGDKIKMIVEMGDNRLLVLKSDRGFIVSVDPDNLRHSTAFYGIGSSNEDPLYTNAVWYGSALIVWNGGGSGFRHYMWDGRSTPVELSRMVREYASEPAKAVQPVIDWTRNLLIFGSVVYDMQYKKVFYFSGNTSASIITRPYYHVHFHPIMLTKIAFFCNGKSGSFKATIEYGQSQDKLSKSKSFVVNITDNTKTRFRHVWTVENPIRCRVWRLHIEELKGVGITQIDACTSIDDTPDSYDGEA